jgi:cysteine desulfurase
VIYLDYNATTPLDGRAFEAMVPYMNKDWGNPSSPYSFGNQARIAVQKARERTSEPLAANPQKSFSSVARSDNLAVRWVAHALRSRQPHCDDTIDTMR